MRLSLFKAIFKSMLPKKIKALPEIGSIWMFDDTSNNPFKRCETLVKVKAVKEGWVLYAMLPEEGSRLFQNETMKLDSFYFCYKPAPGSSDTR